ncbi:right-handed parallel beta-helix repeat-containing protein [Microbacterium memoriense]|uniref:Right-handed parallel beta-helix repeat-containing protein n=1 Tax=Microbacterium memoriense TaxID=2978350 RepID=A0ABT2PDD1_9MICO|nr:right-handed parallel beta-helix repeat-containing protein [Microbacterium memoriense]MCT9002592.1 right-handed parallel beta-helix repeat-containing protein [Microbacterium memoriense]
MAETSAAAASTESASASACGEDAIEVGPTAEELQRALDDAEAGDVLALSRATYLGNFTITTSGTDTAPVTVCGLGGAVIDGGDLDRGYVLHVDGASNWVLTDFAVRGGAKGIMLDRARGNVLRNLEVTDTGHEGIHLRTESTDNLIVDTIVRNTGLVDAELGEGIYIGSAESNWCTHTACDPDSSDRNTIRRVTIESTRAEAIDVKEGTKGGTIESSHLGIGADTVADSVVDIKGDDWTVTANVIAAPAAAGIRVYSIAGWGARNTLRSNEFDLAADALAVEIVGEARNLDNRVSCTNVTTSGSTALTNVACRE